MSTLDRAIKIATAVHKGQIDKSGEPYLLHPLRVMGCVEGADKKIAAILHDVLEDSAMTIGDLKTEGFSEEILCVVEALTHKKGEPYADYIKRISGNPIARKIKIADLKDNMNLVRIKNPTKKDLQRIERYRNALTVLQNVGNDHAVSKERNKE